MRFGGRSLWQGSCLPRDPLQAGPGVNADPAKHLSRYPLTGGARPSADLPQIFCRTAHQFARRRELRFLVGVGAILLAYEDARHSREVGNRGEHLAFVFRWRLDPGVREDVGRQLSIDNNASERAMRSVAIGRKNGMFVGSLPAGRRAPVLMTLIASCKANLMEPWAWLRDVLTQMPRGVFLQSLLPHTWLKAHAEQWISYFLANAPREEYLQKLNVK